MQLPPVLSHLDRPVALFIMLALLSVFEPVFVLLAVGHGGDYSLFHSTVSSIFWAFGRKSSNLFSAEAAETSMTTGLPSTSTMMNRSLKPFVLLIQGG
jgi:hypothetical protein